MVGVCRCLNGMIRASTICFLVGPNSLLASDQIRPRENMFLRGRLLKRSPGASCKSCIQKQPRPLSCRSRPWARFSGMIESISCCAGTNRVGRAIDEEGFLLRPEVEAARTVSSYIARCPGQTKLDLDRD